MIKIFDSAEGYSSDVLPKSDYGYDILPPNLEPLDYGGYDILPPAPPEGCVYVYDPKTGALLGMECKQEYDTPIDVLISPTFETPKLEPVKEPVKQEPLDIYVFGADLPSFPNWDKLTCDELMKSMEELQNTMATIRTTNYDLYAKNLEYAKELYSQKCKSAPVDETPIDIKPIDIKPIDIKPKDVTPVDVPPTDGIGITPEPLPPVAAKEPFKFSWWWLVAAGAGLYLLSSKKNG